MQRTGWRHTSNLVTTDHLVGEYGPFNSQDLPGYVESAERGTAGIHVHLLVRGGSHAGTGGVGKESPRRRFVVMPRVPNPNSNDENPTALPPDRPEPLPRVNHQVT